MESQIESNEQRWKEEYLATLLTTEAKYLFIVIISVIVLVAPWQ